MMRLLVALSLLFVVVRGCTLPYAGPSCEYDCRDYCYRTTAQCSVDTCGIVTCICSDHGQIDTATGLCVCDVGFAGLQCELHYQRSYDSTCGDFQVSGHAIPQSIIYETCNTTTSVARCSGGSFTYIDQVTSELQPLQVCYPPDIGPVAIFSTTGGHYIYRNGDVRIIHKTNPGSSEFTTQFTLEYTSQTSRFDFVIRSAHFPDQFLQINDTDAFLCNGGPFHCRGVILTTLRSGREPTVWRLSGPPHSTTAVTIEARSSPGWHLVYNSDSSNMVVSAEIPARSYAFKSAVPSGAIELDNTAYTSVTRVSTSIPTISGVPSTYSCMSHCLRETTCRKIQYNATSKACDLLSIASGSITRTGVSVWTVSTSNVPCSFNGPTGSYCNRTDLGPYLFSKSSSGQGALTMETLVVDTTTKEFRVEPTFTSVLPRQWVLQQVANSSQVFIFLKDTNLVINVNRLTSVGASLVLELAAFDPDFSASWIMVPQTTNPLSVLFLLVDSFSDPSLGFRPYYLSTTPGLVSDPAVDLRSSLTLNPISSTVLTRATWSLNVELDDTRGKPIQAKKPSLSSTIIASLTGVSEIQCNSICRLLLPQCTAATSTSSSLCELYSDTSIALTTVCISPVCVTYFKSTLTVGGSINVPYTAVFSSGPTSCTDDGVYMPAPLTDIQMFTGALATTQSSICYPLQMNPVRLKHVQTALALDGTNALFVQLRPFQSDFQSVNHLTFVQTAQIGVYHIYLEPIARIIIPSHASAGGLTWSLIIDPGPGARRVYFHDADSTGVIQIPARWHVRDVSGDVSGTVSSVYIESADSRGWFLGVSAGKLVAIEGSVNIEADDSDILWEISTPAIAGSSQCGNSVCVTFGFLTSNFANTVIAVIQTANELECRIACQMRYQDDCFRSVFITADTYHGQCTLYKSSATWTTIPPGSTICCTWSLSSEESLNTYLKTGFAETKRCLIPTNSFDACSPVPYLGTIKASAGPNIFIQATNPLQHNGQQQFYDPLPNIGSSLVVFSPGVSSRPFSIYDVDAPRRGLIEGYNTSAGAFQTKDASTPQSATFRREFNFTEAIATNLPPSPIYIGKIDEDSTIDVILRVNLLDERQCISLCLAQERACVAMSFDTAAASKVCSLFASFIGTPFEEPINSALLAPTVRSWIRDRNWKITHPQPAGPFKHIDTDIEFRTLAGNQRVGIFRMARRLVAAYPSIDLDFVTMTVPLEVGPATDASCTHVCTRAYVEVSHNVANQNFASQTAYFNGISGLQDTPTSHSYSFISVVMRSPTTCSLSLVYFVYQNGIFTPFDPALYGAYLCRYTGVAAPCIAGTAVSGNGEESCLHLADNYDPALCELTFTASFIGATN